MQRLCIAVYRDRNLERVRERERIPVSHATMIREQHDVSKPVEIKYFKFDCRFY